jgi:hypothetical protein
VCVPKTQCDSPIAFSGSLRPLDATLTLRHLSLVCSKCSSSKRSVASVDTSVGVVCLLLAVVAHNDAVDVVHDVCIPHDLQCMQSLHPASQ